MTAHLKRAIGLCLSWLLFAATLYAMAVELRRASARPETHPGVPPSGWRLASTAAAPLRSFLAEQDTSLPPGAIVAVDSAVWKEGELFFFMAWSAYELPRQEVVRAPQLETLAKEDGREFFLLVAPWQQPPPPRRLGLARGSFKLVDASPLLQLYRYRPRRARAAE